MRAWRTDLAPAAVGGGAAGTRADAERLVASALGVPPLPGLADGIARSVLASHHRLLYGWKSDAPLGPLALSASTPP